MAGLNCSGLIEALVDMGWEKTEIAKGIGVTYQSVYRYTKTDKIRKSVLGKLRRLYICAKRPKYAALADFDTVDLVRALRARGWQVTITANNK